MVGELLCPRKRTDKNIKKGTGNSRYYWNQKKKVFGYLGKVLAADTAVWQVSVTANANSVASMLTVAL